MSATVLTVTCGGGWPQKTAEWNYCRLKNYRLQWFGFGHPEISHILFCPRWASPVNKIFVRQRRRQRQKSINTSNHFLPKKPARGSTEENSFLGGARLCFFLIFYVGFKFTGFREFWGIFICLSTFVWPSIYRYAYTPIYLVREIPHLWSKWQTTVDTNKKMLFFFSYGPSYGGRNE